MNCNPAAAADDGFLIIFGAPMFVMALMWVLGEAKTFIDRSVDEEGKIKKKGVKMPRIFRIISYGLLVSLLWKFVDNIEEIALFIVNRFL